MNISFIGLGKLGLAFSLCLAKENNILAIDKNIDIINKLNNNILHYHEENMYELFNLYKKKFIEFTTSYDNIFIKTSITFILVNTQDEKNGYSSKIVEDVLKNFSLKFKEIKTNNYHLIILSSTVIPGTIVQLIKLIENISDKKYGKDFGFSYVPDFVALGNLVYDFLNPDIFLIGVNNDRDFDLTVKIFKNFHNNNVITKRLTIEESEITKISINSYIVYKISFANFLGMICQKIKNINIDNITSAMGEDKRISPYYFKSGIPYGGACFPRDVEAYKKFCTDNNLYAENLIFCEKINNLLYDNLIQEIIKYKKIAIFGISFKNNTDVIIGSPSLILLEKLEKYELIINIHDEKIKNYPIKNGVYYDDIQKCINESECIVIMHNNINYKKFNYDGKKILDLWKVL